MFKAVHEADNEVVLEVHEEAELEQLELQEELQMEHGLWNL